MDPADPIPRRLHYVLIAALLLAIPVTIGFGEGDGTRLEGWFWRLLPIGAAAVLIRRRQWGAFVGAVFATTVATVVGGTGGWLASAVAYAITCLVLLAEVFRTRVVTRETVSGALCAYLLLGVTFAMLYGGACSLEPGAITGVGGVSDQLYFSFITLTTVGYGDAAPVSGAARGLAVLEALLGQLFLVAVVARLVGRLGAPSPQ